MIKTLFVVGVLLVPSMALAQGEAGGGGSGAGGSENMDNVGGYVPADDPSCPRERSWDWFLYCSQTESIPYYTDPHSGRDHSCDGTLKFAITVCSAAAVWAGAGHTALWCGVAGGMCAAGATWGYIEDAYNNYFTRIDAARHQEWMRDFGESYAMWFFGF